MSINSLVNSLKNKVKYNLHQAVNDPEANEFAAEQPDEPLFKKEEVVEEDKDYFDITSTDSDPNKFNPTRFLKKIGNHVVRVVKTAFVPCIMLILSMYVANELIVYSAPIRFIFFVFTFLICYLFKPMFIILLVYYLCKAGYSYYINELTKGPKVKIMPTIFALLPLTTYKPTTALGSFFMYPFTYPKTSQDEERLPVLMKEYLKSLKKSFSYFETVQSLPSFVEGMERLEENLSQRHEPPKEPEVSDEPIVNAPMPAVIKKNESTNSSASNNEKVNTTEAQMPAAIKKNESTNSSASNNGKVNSTEAPMPAAIKKNEKEWNNVSEQLGVTAPKKPVLERRPVEEI